MALWQIGNSGCKVNPHLLQALNPMQGFGETMPSMEWKSSFSEERHFVTLLTSEGYRKMPSWERPIVWYWNILEAWKQGSWVTESWENLSLCLSGRLPKEVVMTREGSDMVSQRNKRSSGTKGCGGQRPSNSWPESHCQRIIVDRKYQPCCWQVFDLKFQPPGCLCYLLGGFKSWYPQFSFWNREMSCWAGSESTEELHLSCICCQASLRVTSQGLPNHKTYTASSTHGNEPLGGLGKHWNPLWEMLRSVCLLMAGMKAPSEA
jgi:hypothetical protein